MTLTAFALAGLGGFNAHGAGFLAAATTSKMVPDLVTATSGQILVLADWLQGEDLEQALVSPGLEDNFMAQVAIALTGDLESSGRLFSRRSGGGQSPSHGAPI